MAGRAHIHEKIERTRSVETILSDERDQRIRDAAATAIGEWLEASPLGYARSIGTLGRWEIQALADAAIGAFIKAAASERQRSSPLPPQIEWLFSG